MCKTHWNQYTAGLARDAKARKARDGTQAEARAAAQALEPEPASKRKHTKEAPTPVAAAHGDAG